MHTILTSAHMEITGAIREYTLEKMKSLDKLVDASDTTAKLTIELSKTSNHHVHGQVFQAEGQIRINGKDTTLRTTQDDLYKAIDVLKDMLTRELAKHKDKERSLVRRGAHKVKSLFKKLV